MAKPKQPTDRMPKAPPVKAQPAKTAPAKTAPAKTAPAKTGAANTGAATARPPAAVPPPESPPGTVRLAVKLMYAGAALSGLIVVLALTTSGQVRSALRTAHPHLSTAAVNTQVHDQIVSSAVLWLITIAFWIVMARTNLAGRGWARILSTVLCVLSTFNFAATIFEHSSLVSKVVYAPLWLVGVGALILLWRPETSAYIQAGRPDTGRLLAPPRGARR
jgi:hypothetical protein